MKFFILMSIVSLPLFGAKKPLMIDKVRSIDFEKDEAIITFWSTNQVYRLPANATVMPCLENAQKAKKQVVMEVNEDAKLIESCRLYGGGKPRL